MWLKCLASAKRMVHNLERMNAMLSERGLDKDIAVDKQALAVVSETVSDDKHSQVNAEMRGQVVNINAGIPSSANVQTQLQIRE